MTMWAMEHPVMTFTLALLAILVAEESVANICTAVMSIWGHRRTEEAADEETEQ